MHTWMEQSVTAVRHILDTCNKEVRARCSHQLTVLSCHNCHPLTRCDSEPRSARSVPAVCGKFLLGVFWEAWGINCQLLDHAHCSNWRSLMSCEQTVCHGASDDDDDVMWKSRGLVYCYFFSWTAVLQWWFPDQCTLLHVCDSTALWRMEGGLVVGVWILVGQFCVLPWFASLL